MLIAGCPPYEILTYKVLAPTGIWKLQPKVCPVTDWVYNLESTVWWDYDDYFRFESLADATMFKLMWADWEGSNLE